MTDDTIFLQQLLSFLQLELSFQTAFSILRFDITNVTEKFDTVKGIDKKD